MYTIQIREVRTGEISFETLEEAKQWHENREGDVYWYHNDEKCKLEKTNLNYLFKNLGGYSMDYKTKFETKSMWKGGQIGLFKDEIREKILHRCEVLRYMGDDGIPSIYDQMTDMELYYDCIWVLDKEHDDLDNFQLGLTRRS